MKKFLILITIISVTITLSAQKRSFELDDIYRVKNVSAPVLSHDGTKIAFTVSSYDLKASTSITSIYTCNVDGSGMKRFTDDSLSYSDPMWCPKDMGLYYVSGNDESSKILFKTLNGDEITTIAESYFSIDSPKLSPDGKHFLFNTKVFPECGIDTECNKSISEAMDNGPIQAHLADSLLLRHWTQYEDGQVTHIVLFNIEDKTYTDLTPGVFNSPTYSEAGNDDYEFSPDGKVITFSSIRVNNPEITTNSDVWSVSANGEDLKNFTSSNEAYDGHGKYSPDGKFLAYTRQYTPTNEADIWDLVIVDLKTGKEKNLTAGMDTWINNFQWTGDSQSIYFDIDEKGYNPILKVDIKTSKVERILENFSLRGWTLSEDEGYIYFNYSFVNKPTDIARYEIENGNLEEVTSFNKKLTDEVEFSSVEDQWIKGADGVLIHVWLVKPYDFDPNNKYPLIINVHGGPQMQWTNSYRANWQMFPSYGYVIAFPNAHGSTGYGKEFCLDISQGGWAGNVFTDIQMITDSLENLPYVDKERIGAMGWSYGGYHMNMIQAKTKRYKALVSMMGIYDAADFYYSTEEQWFADFDLGGKPWENKERFRELSPSNYVENFNTPTLIITGERDYRVSYMQSVRYFTALQMKGIDSRIIVFDNDGHWPSHLKSMPLYYNSHLEWFNKYLGGKAAPYDSKKLVRNLAY